MASQIYNVNLEIIYFDTIPTEENLEEKIKCSKVKFKINSIHDAPTITLMYNFNSYGKYYTNSFYEKHKNILGKYYSSINNKILLEENYDCDKCKIKTKKVSFKRQEYSCCFNCLKTYAEQITIERIKFYEIENLISRECKCFY